MWHRALLYMWIIVPFQYPARDTLRLFNSYNADVIYTTPDAANCNICAGNRIRCGLYVLGTEYWFT